MKKTIYLLTLSSLAMTQSLFPSPEGDANYKIAASYFLDVLNGGHIELVDELFADGWRFGNSGNRTGEGVVERFFEWFIANEARIEILEHIADEKWVYIMFRLTYRWPDYAQDSDKKETDTLIRHARMRIENGKIVDFRLIGSRLNQLKELSGFEGTFEDMVKALSSK